MKAQAVVQQVVVHQHRGAQKPHGAHHGRRVRQRLRHADGAREGVTIGHFKPPVCCAVVIKAISLQKELYTLRSMFIIFWLLVAFIICFFLCAFVIGIIKGIEMTPDEWRDFVEDYRREKKQKKESKRLYRSIESRAIAKYPGRANYRKRKAYIDKHL